MNELIQIASNNIAAIAMAGLFLYYMVRRDKQMEDALDRQEAAFRSLIGTVASLQQENARTNELLRLLVGTDHRDDVKPGNK